MEIQPKRPTAKGPADLFIGDVWFDVIANGEEPSRIRVNTVRLSPGARTAWHAHAVAIETTGVSFEARGEDYSHRAANGSEYLLAGLIVCDRCGKRFIGTAARATGTATGG